MGDVWIYIDVRKQWKQRIHTLYITSTPWSGYGLSLFWRASSWVSVASSAVNYIKVPVKMRWIHIFSNHYSGLRLKSTMLPVWCRNCLTFYKCFTFPIVKLQETHHSPLVIMSYKLEWIMKLHTSSYECSPNIICHSICLSGKSVLGYSEKGAISLWQGWKRKHKIIKRRNYIRCGAKGFVGCCPAKHTFPSNP